jgi:hypothetical protein
MIGRRSSLRAVALLAAVVFATAAWGEESAATKGPSVADLDGFAGVKFGTGIEDARKALPPMTPIADDVKMPSASFSSPFLKRFLIKDQKIEGLSSPVDVELRFWKDQLWAFLVYFKETDRQAALDYLEKTYGKHPTGTDSRPIWRGEKVTLQSMSEGGWFGATDNALSDDARAWFFQALTGNPEGNAPAATAASPGPTGSPAAVTPVAGATPATPSK